MTRQSIIGYTFIRLSYKYGSKKPYLDSRAEIFVNRVDCDTAVRNILNADFAILSKESIDCGWDHKYINIHECSSRADYEIRGYTTKEYNGDFIILRQYIIYPIFNNNKSNVFHYREVELIPTIIRDKRGIRNCIKAVRNEVQIGCEDNINAIIDKINYFLAYMNCIGG